MYALDSRLVYNQDVEHTAYAATINARGLYNSFQFVLRLSPEIHRRLNLVGTGIFSLRQLSWEDIEAFSTYLHETVHWWQHVGSTSGFLLSLSFPVQTHVNYGHLNSFLNTVGPRKPIIQVAKELPNTGYGTPAGFANTIVNNYHDMKYFRSAVISPSSIKDLAQESIFESIGYSYFIAYSNIIATIGGSLDPKFDYIPNPTSWMDELNKLRNSRTAGYYYGSPITLPPVGALEIFEGQARFIQLQYLYFASGTKLSWDDINKCQMLGGVYGEAFRVFLKLTESSTPTSVGDPLVAVFLVICDMAINPGSGFPLSLASFSTFIEDIDPGTRFCFLCWSARRHMQQIKPIVRRYTRDEYIQICSILAEPIRFDVPIALCNHVKSWPANSGEFGQLMNEHQTFRFNRSNLPIRVLLSHFIKFNEDKYRYPEFFVWPGAWMVGDNCSPLIEQLFDIHRALFVDKEDDDGIFARSYDDRADDVVHKVFQIFYEANINYDMTAQWIDRYGPFKYAYDWLVSDGTPRMMKEFADSVFEHAYGTHPDDFLISSSP